MSRGQARKSAVVVILVGEAKAPEGLGFNKLEDIAGGARAEVYSMKVDGYL